MRTYLIYLGTLKKVFFLRGYCNKICYAYSSKLFSIFMFYFFFSGEVDKNFRNITANKFRVISVKKIRLSEKSRLKVNLLQDSFNKCCVINGTSVLAFPVDFLWFTVNIYCISSNKRPFPNRLPKAPSPSPSPSLSLLTLSKSTPLD